MNTEPYSTVHQFGLIVTGRGEEVFLPSFFRSLSTEHACFFRVIRRVDQLSPFRSEAKLLRMVGSGQRIPTKDVEEIGLPARNFLTNNPNSYVILVDDLEYSRRDIHQAIFDRYRAALDHVTPTHLHHRASVHFFVNMIEAYYFADVDAVNTALGCNLEPFDDDVETIRNPKGQLKAVVPKFNEIDDGKRIVSLLDLEKVLGNPETCASLRAMVKWCMLAKRETLTERFYALSGRCCQIAGQQTAVPK